MKTAQVEDCGDCGELLEHDSYDSFEAPPSLTLFKNPAGMLAIVISGSAFYSALAYGIWRMMH